MAFELAPLPYANNALEPHFDALTMEIHHDRHHNAYVTNLNAAVTGTALEGKYLEELFSSISACNSITISFFQFCNKCFFSILFSCAFFE